MSATSGTDLLLVASLQDEASAGVNALRNNVNSDLRSIKMSTRELAMGFGFLGSSMVSMGVMLKSSNSEMGQSAGQTLLVAGSMLTAVSAAAHLIESIAAITRALKALTAAEILAKAFSPAGLATIAVGGIVAAGTIAAVNASSEKKVTTNININNKGAVMTDITSNVRTANIKINQQTPGAGNLP